MTKLYFFRRWVLGVEEMQGASVISHQAIGEGQQDKMNVLQLYSRAVERCAV
jgi:hypothetical protein